MKNKKIIGILCPVFNEEENILIFYNSFLETTSKLSRNYSFEFLFADNCSTDSSFLIIKSLAKNDSHVHGFRYSKNFGVMKSIYTGIIKSPKNWSAIAIFDCDLQDPPNLLLDFISEWESGNKIVFGVRKFRDEPFLMSSLRNVYKVIENFVQKEKRKLESGAWLLDKRVIEELRIQNIFQPFLPGLLDRLGFKSKGIEYARVKRKMGHTKFNFFSYFLYATDGIVGGSTTPLKISIFFGFFVGMASLVIAIYFVFAKLVFQLEFQEGIVAMIVLMLLNFGINFFFLGILGEYIGRLYQFEETRLPAIIDERV